MRRADELVFDGGSFGLNGDRTLAFQMAQFDAGIAVTTWKKTAGAWRSVDGPKAALSGREEANWRACVAGLRDYVNKNGFPGVVLGSPPSASIRRWSPRWRSMRLGRLASTA